jgi:hypothetical protein
MLILVLRLIRLETHRTQLHFVSVESCLDADEALDAVTVTAVPSAVLTDVRGTAVTLSCS